MKNNKLGNKILTIANYLSKITFEIYLIHIFLNDVIKLEVFSDISNNFKCISLVLLTLILSIGLNKISRLLISKQSI